MSNPLNLQTPHDDEITWDAHDRVIERHYRQECDMQYESKPKRIIRKGFALLFLLIVGAALIGSLYMFSETRKLEQTVITYATVDGIEYRCAHLDGDMHCVSVDDPDVGGGRIQP